MRKDPLGTRASHGISDVRWANTDDFGDFIGKIALIGLRVNERLEHRDAA